MQAKNYPSDVLEQANSVLTAVNQINEELSFGDVSPSLLQADVAELLPVLSQISQLETRLTEARNQRDATSMNMWDKIKRIRLGVKAHYGDDSSEYELVGGTRLSDRKRPARKPTSTKE